MITAMSNTNKVGQPAIADVDRESANLTNFRAPAIRPDYQRNRIAAPGAGGQVDAGMIRGGQDPASTMADYQRWNMTGQRPWNTPGGGMGRPQPGPGGMGNFGLRAINAPGGPSADRPTGAFYKNGGYSPVNGGRPAGPSLSDFIGTGGYAPGLRPHMPRPDGTWRPMPQPGPGFPRGPFGANPISGGFTGPGNGTKPGWFGGGPMPKPGYGGPIERPPIGNGGYGGPIERPPIGSPGMPPQLPGGPPPNTPTNNNYAAGAGK